MSILSALSENRHDKKNLEDLAKLPQALIMQMGQRKELSQEEVAMIINKKAEAIESAARQKALAQGGGQMPSVIEQDMMKIAQAENPAPQQMQQPMMPQQMAQAPQLPEDVGIAQNPIPPMQMAGGGIIAFDEGGDVDEEDEYQDLIDQAQEDETSQNIFDLISEMGNDVVSNAGAGITAGTGFQSFSAPDNRNTEYGIKAGRGEDKGDLIGRLRAEIMQRESGGRRYDKDGNLLTSSKGALGEMQVMPATAKDPGFGIKPARNNSPDELRRVGDEYASILLNRYQDPKLAMIAYNMGPGATDKWLASGADIRKLPKETQGYIRGVNLASGGEVKHFVRGDLVMDDYGYPRGADPRSTPIYDDFNRTAAELENEIERNKKAGRPLSKEAQRYLESKTPKANVTQPKPPAGIGALRGTSIPVLAAAGAGALYQGLSGPDQVNIPTEADVNPGDLTPEEIEAAKRPALIYPRIRGKERYAVDLPVTREQKAKPISTKPAATSKDNKTKVTPPGIPDELKNAQIASPQQNKPPAQDLTPKEKAEEETFNLMKYIQDRQAKMDKAAEGDKNLALLAAGLGMLGGTSQYALENIGKGGLTGVQQLGQLQKLRATQGIASDKMLGTAYNAEMLGKLRRDQLAQSRELATDRQKQSLLEKRNAFIQKELGQNPMLSQMLQSLKGEKAKVESTGGKLDPKKLVQLNFYEQQIKDLENKAFRLYPDSETKSNYRLVGVR